MRSATGTTRSTRAACRVLGGGALAGQRPTPNGMVMRRLYVRIHSGNGPHGRWTSRCDHMLRSGAGRISGSRARHRSLRASYSDYFVLGRTTTTMARYHALSEMCWMAWTPPKCCPGTDSSVEGHEPPNKSLERTREE